MSPRRPAPRTWWQGAALLVSLLGSALLFYALRAVGLDVHGALLTATVAGAVPTAVRLARGHRPHGLEAFFTVLLLGAVVVALLPGSGRFVLAKESLLTAATGVWFLLSNRAARPLAYQFARPLAEGRLGWPADWERLWSDSPAFRAMWRRSSTAWGVGTLADAVLRVVLVWTVPADAVPALNLALFVATAVLLNIGTTVFYARCGAFDRRGPFHRPPIAR
jgi:hypothetical protein